MTDCRPDDHRGQRITHEDAETRTYECADCGAEWWEDLPAPVNLDAEKEAEASA